VSLDLDFATIEGGSVHNFSSLLSVLAVSEFNEAKAARVALLVEVHVGVQDWPILFESISQLLSVHAVRQVADVKREPVLHALFVVVALHLLASLLNLQHLWVVLSLSAVASIPSISLLRKAAVTAARPVATASVLPLVKVFSAVLRTASHLLPVLFALKRWQNVVFRIFLQVNLTPVQHALVEFGQRVVAGFLGPKFNKSTRTEK